MNTTVSRQQAVPAWRQRQRRVPWSPPVWGQVVSLAGAIPVQLTGALLPLILVLGTRAAEPSAASLLLIWLLAAAAMIFVLSPALTWVHRHRLRTTEGMRIPPPPRRNLRTWEGQKALLSARSTWRRLGYHLLAAPLLAVAGSIAVVLWPASLALLLAFAINRASGRPVNVLADLLLTAAGVVALFAAPWLTGAVRIADLAATRALLGPSRADELASRVEQLTETRAGVVDAADAERRRLERDLHDGTQQRLVSLAMNLGMARAQAGTAEEARLAIATAHEEAKAALAELRDLIRGLHPAVLEDRGLDAALSGVAARMPLPVRLTVDLPRRPAPVIEAVAYFVVSEGLANVAKHADASEVTVFVQRAADRLHVIVTDDGVGGADPVRGTGLAGLARRAASVDGTFEIDSPPGGPTMLTVDLPCNR
jgi:signal transduction histidine kinase